MRSPISRANFRSMFEIHRMNLRGPCDSVRNLTITKKKKKKGSFVYQELKKRKCAPSTCIQAFRPPLGGGGGGVVESDGTDSASEASLSPSGPGSSLADVDAV